MKILSVIHYPVFGGPHNRNVRLAPILAEHGMSLTVLLPEEPGNAAERMQAAGVDVVRLPLHRLRASVDPGLQTQILGQFPTEIRQIRKLIRERDIDVVLLNGLINPHAGIAGRLEGKAVVWQILDTFPSLPLRTVTTQVARITADVMMCTGKAVADAHPGARSFGDRLVLFFPPVDTENVRPPDLRQRQAARRELGLSDDDIVIGNVGNLNPMKGHRTFIEAAGRVKQLTNRPCRFVILGGSYSYRSDYEDSLWRLAEQCGVPVGSDLIVRDPEKRVPELASAFDVFWLSAESRSEGIPTAIGEAMALGLPVIAANVGAVAEAVDVGATGFLVPPADPAALAQATFGLVDDKDLRDKLGRAGREGAEAKFALRRCADRHMEAFEMAASIREAKSRRHRGSRGA